MASINYGGVGTGGLFGGLGGGWGGGFGGSSGGIQMPIGGPSTGPYTPGVAPNAAAGSGGIWGWLASMGQEALTNPAVWQAAGQMISGAAESSAQGRERERQREGDLFRRLQQADYLSGGGSEYDPKGLPSYGFGPKASTPNVRKQADDLQSQLMERLEGTGGPGLWEKLATVAGPAASIYGSLGAPGLRR